MSLSEKEILKQQIDDLIKKLSTTKVELETLRMERDLWKEKFVELSKRKETLSKTESSSTSRKTKIPGSVTIGKERKEIDVDVGTAAVFIAKNPELPWKKGKEKAKATI